MLRKLRLSVLKNRSYMHDITAKNTAQDALYTVYYLKPISHGQEI